MKHLLGAWIRWTGVGDEISSICWDQHLAMAGRSCGGRRAAAASNWAGEGCQRGMSTSHRRAPLSSSAPIVASQLSWGRCRRAILNSLGRRRHHRRPWQGTRWREEARKWAQPSPNCTTVARASPSSRRPGGLKKASVRLNPWIAAQIPRDEWRDDKYTWRNAKLVCNLDICMNLN